MSWYISFFGHLGPCGCFNGYLETMLPSHKQKAYREERLALEINFKFSCLVLKIIIIFMFKNMELMTAGCCYEVPMLVDIHVT